MMEETPRQLLKKAHALYKDIEDVGASAFDPALQVRSLGRFISPVRPTALVVEEDSRSHQCVTTLFGVDSVAVSV